MLTKRMLSGAALVLSMSAAARVAVGQGRPPQPTAVPGGEGVARATGESGAAQAAYFAGLRARGSDVRRRHFAAGIEAARARLRTDPRDPEGLLWLAANLGGQALEKGKLFALGVLPEMERLLLTLEATAPEYDHAAAARTLGRLYHLAPAIISIGSMKKARVYWQRALDRAGQYGPNQVLAADFFDDDGEEQRARELAGRYLQRPTTEQEHPEAAQWQKIAVRIAGQGAR
jgi:hypothetical protein